MKNLKKLFILVFCFTLMVTTTTVPSDKYVINNVMEYEEELFFPKH